MDVGEASQGRRERSSLSGAGGETGLVDGGDLLNRTGWRVTWGRRRNPRSRGQWT